jgi:hypothetical protein
VGLSVTDNSKASATAFTTVDVTDTPPVAAGGSGGLTVRNAGSVTVIPLMSPFPIVHLNGILRPKGIELRLFSVTAPLGATVIVRCHGRRCPFRKRTRSVQSPKRSNSKSVPGVRSIRIRGLESRLLRAGLSLRLFVTRGAEIGKYTRIDVRRGRLPARIDRCLLPNPKHQVVRCPSR